MKDYVLYAAWILLAVVLVNKLRWALVRERERTKR